MYSPGWDLAAPPTELVDDIRQAGLDGLSLVFWATASTSPVGPGLDGVVLGSDEDANLIWGVETRLRGRDVGTEEDPPPDPPAHLDASGRPGFA